jgi:hypothetical protein
MPLIFLATTTPKLYYNPTALLGSLPPSKAKQPKFERYWKTNLTHQEVNQDKTMI